VADRRAAAEANVVLTVNAGSTSLRLAAFRVEQGQPKLFWQQRLPGAPEQQSIAVHEMLRALRPAPTLVAHRIVQGGPALNQARIVDETLLADVGAAAALAPLHDPQALRGHAWACEVLPGLPQVFVPDSGFFTALPPRARSYALPHALVAQHQLHRYGFHGLAHESIWRGWRAAGGKASDRIISLQLGGGCSAALIEGGRPRASSMGMTPLEGLVMASRSGDVDPGLILYLIRSGRASAEQLEQMLYRESGLLGLSGRSGEVSALLQMPDEAARLALAVYVERIRHYLGAYMALAGGVDGIAFGGGVGEHVPEIRAAVLGDMAWCGVRFDAQANAAARGGQQRLTSIDSPVTVRVLPVDEESLLAEHALRALLSDAAPP